MDGWEGGIRTCSGRQSAVTLTRCVNFPSESPGDLESGEEGRCGGSCGPLSWSCLRIC